MIYAIAFLIAVACSSCAYRELPGQHLTEKARACILSGLDIKVLERNDHAEIVCQPK